MQGHSCRTTDILFHGEDRSEARVSSVTILIPARHRLNREKDYRKQKKRDPVELEDMDFTDDLVLPQGHQQMQEKSC